MSQNETDRRHFTSVAVSFGNRDDLARLGSGACDLTCPSCGARGTRYGNPGGDMRFEGFDPVTRGGLVGIVVKCDACADEVVLPHVRA